ncbi:MAG: formylglycine-generating enzyme family protein [Deltaproteobacteria bacterium]|jgi:formylglycine-generating enzyme required for sulfatase activity|nr:formylglycine-generating enzyme family protein [Deltaproteobacteria bacterium]
MKYPSPLPGPSPTAASATAFLLAAALPLLAPSAVRAEDFITTVGAIELVLVEPGSFTMGDRDGLGYEDERPLHAVDITRPFYIGRFEITQTQYAAVMDNNPSAAVGPDRPVECVSWEDAQEFARKLGRLEGAEGFRLPTEAEWEFAARAGTKESYLGGSGPGGIGPYAWYGGNSGGGHRPVGLKAPNAWGLHDVLGNVWEWTADRYDPDYYAKSPRNDPQGPDRGSSRIFRGGAWPWDASSSSLTKRGNYSYQDYAGSCPFAPAGEEQGTSMWDTDLGFRVAFSDPPGPTSGDSGGAPESADSGPPTKSKGSGGSPKSTDSGEPPKTIGRD